MAPALLLLLAALPGGLVDAAPLVPDAVLDLRYAGSRNLAGRPLYPVPRCLLLAPVATRLARAAAALRVRGFRLVLWDCYRPLSVQRELWRVLPDRRWVADPARGSNHNRGAAVDVALADAAGKLALLPTDHDAFDVRARPWAGAERGIPPEALRNRRILREEMERAGFLQDRGEWWHYDEPGGFRMPLLDVPLAGPGAP
jgi:D-alanyl-D-alanine dipeptidase